MAQNRFSEAETCFRESLSIFRTHFPDDSNSLFTLERLRDALSAQQKDAEVDNLLKGVAQEQRNRKPSGRDATDGRRWLAWAEILEFCKDWTLALEAYRQAAALWKDPPRSASVSLGHGFYETGRHLYEEGAINESDVARLFEQSVGHLQRAFADLPLGGHLDGFRGDLALAHVFLSERAEKSGDFDHAIASRKEALRRWEELSKTDAGNEWFRQQRAALSTTLAELLCSLDRDLTDAVQYAEAGIRLHQELAADYPQKSEYGEQLARSEGVKAKIAAKLGGARQRNP